MSESEPRFYTWDDVEQSFIRKASNYTAWRYRRYGVAADDVQQELYAWLYGRGKKKVERWLGNDPQQTTRTYMSLLTVAKTYAEKEKAAVAGYEVDDVYWYTPAAVESLLPLAENPEWTGESDQPEAKSRSTKPLHERGDLLAMVMDVRCAAVRVGWEPQRIADYLNGERPRVGRRTVLSNAAAQAITADQA